MTKKKVKVEEKGIAEKTGEVIGEVAKEGWDTTTGIAKAVKKGIDEGVEEK